jgi:hypothetical protein
MRYTFSDDEEDSDDFPSRRSTRNSGVSTPAAQAGPTVTASGRHVKSRLGGMYGETMLVDQRKELENERVVISAAGCEKDQDESSEQPQRSRRSRRPIRAPRRIDDSSEDMKGQSDVGSSGNEWSGNEEEPDEKDAEEFEADVVADDDDEEDDDEMSANDSEMDDVPPEQDSLVVQLRYKKEGDASQPKAKERPSLEDGDEAIADCIAVDSGQPAKAPDSTVHLNGEVSQHYEPAPKATHPLQQSLPRQSVNGVPNRPSHHQPRP